MNQIGLGHIQLKTVFLVNIFSIFSNSPRCSRDESMQGLSPKTVDMIIIQKSLNAMSIVASLLNYTFFSSLLKTDRFHVAMCLFSN